MRIAFPLSASGAHCFPEKENYALARLHVCPTPEPAAALPHPRTKPAAAVERPFLIQFFFTESEMDPAGWVGFVRKEVRNMTCPIESGPFASR